MSDRTAGGRTSGAHRRAAKRAAKRAGRKAARGTVRAARSRGGRFLARGGFAFVGLLHLIVAFLALRVALGGRREHADQSGAVAAIAAAPAGLALLWAGAVCCAALGLWWLSEAVLSSRRAWEGPWTVVTDAGKAAVFLAVGGLFASYALGSRKDSREASQDLTALVLGAPAGQAALVAAGLAVVGSGVYYAWRGLARRFARSEVRPHGRARTPVLAVGVAGYVGKGAALAILGILVVVAAVRLDPTEQTGLDGALRGLAAQPYGTWLLGAIALGLACFGVYSMARAKYGEV
ncbi:DUF1206 domain-containing protein [Sinomonas halotolerans]|uniref:DUF1206 domain-containing protein n=1 Tax=Sinomonas halotolerans TaxID=1644133 RepID=A0ABU9WXN5_9MICC